MNSSEAATVFLLQSEKEPGTCTKCILLKVDTFKKAFQRSSMSSAYLSSCSEMPLFITEKDSALYLIVLT